VADVNKISDSRIRTNSSSNSHTLDQQKVEALQPVTSYTLPPTNLVAQLLLESPPELVSQIPLDHLAQKDIVEVFNNIPKNKIASVIKQMPQERVASILSKLPEKDRNELKNFTSQSIH
jgi:Mg/Co/Ni transporter MgtE